MDHIKKYDEILNDVKTWDKNKREWFEERAAIMEFDGLLSRENAEIEAYFIVKKIK